MAKTRDALDAVNAPQGKSNRRDNLKGQLSGLES